MVQRCKKPFFFLELAFFFAEIFRFIGKISNTFFARPEKILPVWTFWGILRYLRRFNSFYCILASVDFWFCPEAGTGFLCLLCCLSLCVDLSVPWWWVLRHPQGLTGFSEKKLICLASKPRIGSARNHQMFLTRWEFFSRCLGWVAGVTHNPGG